MDNIKVLLLMSDLLGLLTSPKNCMEAKVAQQKPARTVRQRSRSRKVFWKKVSKISRSGGSSRSSSRSSTM